jgi:hypothetical protein
MPTFLIVIFAISFQFTMYIAISHVINTDRYSTTKLISMLLFFCNLAICSQLKSITLTIVLIVLCVISLIAMYNFKK